jgi:prepilin-type N-terminal cleavage/methylation domain-containing protein
MKSRQGFSLIELLIVISIILIILAIALPHFQKTMMLSREMAAIAAVKTLQSAEAQYYAVYGRYPQSLAEFGKPSSGAPNASAADLVSGDLAQGEKGGYNFTVQATPNGYQINAEPIAYNNSGSRTFYADQSGPIHQHPGSQPATAADPEIR